MKYTRARWLSQTLALILSFVLTAALAIVFPKTSFADDMTELTPDAVPLTESGDLGIHSLADMSFQMTIQTTQQNNSFILPTSSKLYDENIGKYYNWDINWGDQSSETVSGNSASDSGIRHEYPSVGVFTITIKPAGSTEAWLAAFGFSNGTAGSNDIENKEMVIGVIGPLNPEMTRSNEQINGSIAAPINEWAYTFFKCTNLTVGPSFVDWDTVTTAGNNFADSLFSCCSRLNTFLEGFTLPKNIVLVGDYFANQMFNECFALAKLPNSFNLPQRIAKAGDCFLFGMFRYCTSLAALPGGFNIPQGFLDVGYSFAAYLFLNCSSLASLPAGFNFPQSIQTTGDYFAFYMFGSCSSLSQLPVGFNLPPNINTVGSLFVGSLFEYCTKLAALPQNFNLPQGITSVGDYFASDMFFCCSSLITLPAGFNLPKGLTRVGHTFARGMFSCCYSLRTLPAGFNLPQGIISVGDYFASRMFDTCSDLRELPSGFNLPPGITLTGNGFASYMFNRAGGPTFQLNAEFRFPTSVSTFMIDSYFNTLFLSDNAPVQNRTAASIIGLSATPTNERETFSRHFSDIDFIAINWGGRGLMPNTVGPPGSGDLNGDGSVTMDEVIIALRATVSDIGLTPAQRAALDMNQDGVITVADVVMILRMTI
ncbi:MAG: hypothetical protein FWH40_00100 [Coriobacteriia bacterium]|nr:hypothetical protein [Coriobacteriia bacterium]